MTTTDTLDENSIEEKLGETSIDDFDKIFDLEKAGQKGFYMYIKSINNVERI